MKTFKFFSLCVAALAFTLIACDKSNEPSNNDSKCKLVKHIRGTYSDGTIDWTYQYYDDGTLKQVKVAPSKEGIWDYFSKTTNVIKSDGKIIFVEVGGDSLFAALNASSCVINIDQGTHLFTYTDNSYLFSKTGGNADFDLTWSSGDLTNSNYWDEQHRYSYTSHENCTNFHPEIEDINWNIFDNAVGLIDCGYFGHFSKHFVETIIHSKTTERFSYVFDADGNPVKVIRQHESGIKITETVFEIEYY